MDRGGLAGVIVEWYETDNRTRNVSDFANHYVTTLHTPTTNMEGILAEDEVWPFYVFNIVVNFFLLQ